MHIVYRQHEFEADILIVFLRKDARLILANIVTVEAVLERERVSDGELLPSDDTRSADLVWLDTEATVLVVEHVRLLREDARQQAHDRPAEEAAVGSRVTTIEETVLFL